MFAHNADDICSRSILQSMSSVSEKDKIVNRIKPGHIQSPLNLNKRHCLNLQTKAMVHYKDLVTQV